ncbi:hypothetical protein [Erwinia tracheiphila]|nr:hypothetical protein [Erwinia tracheiphila]EOS96236.1 hypothetical protein ETR_03899 [Erwinia tracheiphila PSU-1]
MMIYTILLVIFIALIIFSGYKHYKHANNKQLSRPSWRRMNGK